MMSVLRRIPKGLLVVVCVLGFLFFQNCGNIDVGRRAMPSVVLPQAKPTGEFCADSGPSYTTPTKFLFVVDLSLSNVGGELIYQNTVDNQGSNTYRHTLGKHVVEAVKAGSGAVSGGSGYFDISRILRPDETLQQRADRIVVSDGDGKRFEAIQKFLSEPACASISNNFSFSIVGFAYDAMMPAGTSLSCESAFEPDTAVFTQHIAGLKKYQDNDLVEWKKVFEGGPQSPYQMGATNYRKGLLCTAAKVEKDAFEDSEKFPFYYTIFMSDGLTTDKYDACAAEFKSSWGPHISDAAGFTACIQKNRTESCYTPTTCTGQDYAEDSCVVVGGNPMHRDWLCLNSKTLPGIVTDLKDKLEGVAAGFKLQPVFYWPADREALSDFASAEQVMKPLAEAGGVEGLIRLDSENGILGLANNICTKIEANLKTKYTITSYMAVNLTSSIKKGKLVADSDMDGVGDIEESGSGTDPLNPRSNGKVLDGLCAQLGTAACSEAPACDPDLFYGLGFNDCDLKLLQTKSAGKVNGVDTDADSLIDLVEFLKGSQPFKNDSSDMAYVDQTLTIKAAIAKGYDLNNSNKVYPVESHDLMDAGFNFNPSSPTCGENRESLSINIQNVPLVPVKSFEDKRSGSLNLSHAADENLIAIIYQVTPVGKMDSKVKNYVHLVRVSIGNEVTDKITSLNSILLVEAP